MPKNGERGNVPRMSDLAFNVEHACEILRRDTKYYAEILATKSAELEHELRAVAAAVDRGEEGFDIGTAAALHVLEIDTRRFGRMPDSVELELNVYGQNLGRSRFARPLEPGRYRVLVQFTRLPDEVEPPR